MLAARSNQSLLLELPENLSADLFASAAPLRLAADEALSYLAILAMVVL